MSDVAPDPLQPGFAFLGRYQIVRCIKAGGMGAVYEVVHLETRRRRALKVMLPTVVSDPDLRARFRLETTITADIETEHIVETFDAGIDPETGAPFLVMELLKGEDVAGLVERRGPLPAAEVVTLLQQLAIALDKTHAAAIVHRDLKPENLFVTLRDDGSPRLKVLDFGIAKVVARATTEATQAKATRSMGTPLYMAPEQLGGAGVLGPRADLYAVGHVAYTMLVGRSYWEDDPAIEEGVWPLLVKVMAGATEAASVRASGQRVALSAAFDGWFAKATALSPEARFPSALPMIAALAEALGVAVAVPALGRDPLPQPRAPAEPGPASALATSLPALPPSRPPGPLGSRPSGTEVMLTPVAATTGARAAGATFAPTIDPSLPPPRRSALPFIVGAVLLLGGLATTAGLVRRGGGDPPAASLHAEAPTPSAAPTSVSAPVVTVGTTATAPPTDSVALPAPSTQPSSAKSVSPGGTPRPPVSSTKPPPRPPAPPVDPTRSR